MVPCSAHANAAHTSATQGAPSYNCQYCLRSFGREFLRDRHENEIHALTSFYACPDCNFFRLEVQDTRGNCLFYKCCFCDHKDPDANHIFQNHYGSLSRVDLDRNKRLLEFQAHVRARHQDHDTGADSLRLWNFVSPTPRSIISCDLCSCAFSTLQDYEAHSRQARSDPEHEDAASASADDRLTTAMRGLITSAALYQHWQAYLLRWGLEITVLQRLRWSLHDPAASTVLYRLERYDSEPWTPEDYLGPLFRDVLVCGSRSDAYL